MVHELEPSYSCLFRRPCNIKHPFRSTAIEEIPGAAHVNIEYRHDTYRFAKIAYLVFIWK